MLSASVLAVPSVKKKIARVKCSSRLGDSVKAASSAPLGAIGWQ